MYLLSFALVIVGSIIYSIKPTHKRQAPGANESGIALVRRDYDEIPPRTSSTEFGKGPFSMDADGGTVGAASTFVTDPDVTVKYCPVHGTVMVPRSPATNRPRANSTGASLPSNQVIVESNAAQSNQIIAVERF